MGKLSLRGAREGRVGRGAGGPGRGRASYHSGGAGPDCSAAALRLSGRAGGGDGPATGKC